MASYMGVYTMMRGQLPSASAAANRQAAAPVQTRSAVPLSATNFRRSAKPIMPVRMAAGANVSAKERTQLVETYDALVASYDQLLKDNHQQARLGNNVAGALMFLIVSSHYVANDGAELSEKQQEAILRDFNYALNATSEFQKMTDENRQSLFEVCAITGSYVLTLYRTGVDKKDPAHIRTAKEVANLSAEQILGTSFSRVSLQDGVRLP